ncbi:stage II sporulation protein M [Paenibacillus thiaminolyticus]|uniref:stage II sporulation protein M n=1 Tax=Paenibacillus thiaminolyticus TaxID=49283 RepID=UPI001162B0E0|nr:stage II sporulation protein M [Paenibacillus thiaminolyticus]MDG0875219.1 stage II sporulation protein M [Paenibacillus thiaminolyticus]NGP57001.1 stage II sporulation protein M [Paenibacillus thiaminolyticus]WCR27801.1 stage II sporulation protein M [Paenibacillus thiaminolyticus]
MKPASYSFRPQLHLYLFVSILFLVGVVFGALLVNALTLEQQQDLGSHLGHFFVMLDGDSPAPDRAGMFTESAMLYSKWIGLIALLGFSIVGFPLVLVLVFAKGIFIGFTVGTLIGQYGWKGMLFAFASVAPHNLLAIPLILIASVASITFATYILKNRVFMPKVQSLREPLGRFVLVQTSAAAGMAVVAAVMTWVSPSLMKLAAPLLAGTVSGG